VYKRQVQRELVPFMALKKELPQKRWKY